jgi:hypothetical protein
LFHFSVVDELRLVKMVGGMVDNNWEEQRFCSICGKGDGEIYQLNGESYCKEHFPRIDGEATLSFQDAEPEFTDEGSILEDASKVKRDHDFPVPEKLSAYKYQSSSNTTTGQKVPDRSLVINPSTTRTEQEVVEGEVVNEDSLTEQAKPKTAVVVLAILATIGWLLFFIWVGKVSQMEDKQTALYADMSELRSDLNNQISTLQAQVNDYSSQLTSAKNQISGLSSTVSLLTCSEANGYTFDYSSSADMLTSLKTLVTGEDQAVTNSTYERVFSNSKVTRYKIWTKDHLQEFIVFFTDDIYDHSIIFWVDRACLIH